MTPRGETPDTAASAGTPSAGRVTPAPAPSASEGASAARTPGAGSQTPPIPATPIPATPAGRSSGESAGMAAARPNAAPAPVSEDRSDVSGLPRREDAPAESSPVAASPARGASSAPSSAPAAAVPSRAPVSGGSVSAPRTAPTAPVAEQGEVPVSPSGRAAGRRKQRGGALGSGSGPPRQRAGQRVGRVPAGGLGARTRRLWVRRGRGGRRQCPRNGPACSDARCPGRRRVRWGRGRQRPSFPGRHPEWHAGQRPRRGGSSGGW
ncbi:hypothetical protein ACXXDK_09905 [Deinococcus sp. PESE-38]